MNAQKDAKGAATAREAGNTSYKKGKWAEAIGHYAQATRLDPTDPAPLLNRAQAYIKLEKWQDVIRDCNSVLALPDQASNVKALFRRSLARRETAEWDAAVRDLDLVLKIEPGNSAAKEELASLKEAISKRKEKDRTTASKLVDLETKPIIPPLSLEASSTKRTAQTSAKSSVTSSKHSTPAAEEEVTIPVKLVPSFSPRSARASGSSQAAHPTSTPGPSKAAPAPASASAEGFAQKKAGRENKKSFAGGSFAIEAMAQSGAESVKLDEKRAKSAQVAPPISGLDLIDRVMSAENDAGRWDILESLPAAKVGAWLDPLIEPDHLAAIYQAIFSRVGSGDTPERSTAKDLIVALVAMKRWKMVQGLLSRTEKEVMQKATVWARAD